MSGNPFRRARQQQPESSLVQDDPVPPQSTKTKKKKKTVKIQTPPHSPEEIPRRLSAGRVSPPPPPPSPPTLDHDEEESDSTATADSELEQASRNRRRNSGSLPPPVVGESSTPGAPSNPFARTLATNEAAFGLQRTSDPKDAEKTNGAGASRPNVGPSALDVDAFKNMLMTGSAAPSPPPTTFGRRFQDSTSNTDTSSGSRRSLYDPYLDVHDETPRTSFDDMESPSGSENGDEERSGLMSSNVRLDDFAPPAPPKHSHGRPIGSKGPQTVSFADFDTSISGTSTPASNDLSDTIRPPMIHRSPSDLNKPLPPPPADPASTQPSSTSHSESLSPSTSRQLPADTPKNDIAQLKKSAPPPPPASRRTGQTTTPQNRARSTSNATDDSIPEEPASSPSIPTETTPKSSAPPPPPSRKTKPTPPVSTPTIETPPAAPSPAPSSTDSKNMPPPPPRRNVSKAGNSVNRSPSTASRSSTSKATAATGLSAPPAPPPRRAAGSKRESTDGTAMAGQSLTKTESEESNNTLTENANSQSILADMDSFQKEIDALRARSQGPS